MFIQLRKTIVAAFLLFIADAVLLNQFLITMVTVARLIEVDVELKKSRC